MKFPPPFVQHGAVRASPEALAAGADACEAHALDALLEKRLAGWLKEVEEEHMAL